MKAAPGSQLPIQDIFGRDTFITELWKALDVGSIRLEAERRIGKTSILQKMNAEPPAGWEPIFLDAEQVHSASEFAELVCSEVHKRLEGWKRQANRVRNFLGSMGGTHIGPLKFPERKNQADGYWKSLLSHSVEDLVEQQRAAGKRVAFLFDEMPWMVSAIEQHEGAHAAMQVLDALRSLRQSPTTGPGFRMVLCGSIGLHHVLGRLKQAGYRNEPVNDMRLIEVPPLDPAVAADLASQLLIGEELTGDPTAPQLIAEQTGGFPYYIHWIVAELKKGNWATTAATVDLVVKTLLTAPHDPCNFKHFRTRIDDYYPKEEKPVLALLDHVASNPLPLAQAELMNVARTAVAVDGERVRELLNLLARDHYLNRDTDGRYTFRHPLLRRWWLLERGLV